MFIKSVLNCERPAKCIPPTDDRLKKKKRINTSGVCLLPVSSTDYLRTIRLHSAFFGAGFALTELQENVKEDGSVLQQAATAADGGGAARVIPPPSRPRHRLQTDEEITKRSTERVSLQKAEVFPHTEQGSAMRAAWSGKCPSLVTFLPFLSTGAGGTFWVSPAKHGGSKDTFWILSFTSEVKKTTIL